MPKKKLSIKKSLLQKKTVRAKFPSLATLLFTFFMVFLFFIYNHNITHDIFGGDIGDLVTAAYLLGVAHPPGYPLFTFLGFIASHIPFLAQPVTKVAYVSLFSSLLSVILLKKTLDLLIKSRLVEFISIAILSFSYLFWLYSEIPEVFALNAMLVLLITYCSVRFYKSGSYSSFLSVFFFLGLGLTHHQTIILLLPFVLTLFIKRYKEIFGFKKKLFLATVFFALGLVPYIYIPIAASKNPVINWDSAKTLSGFLDLITRRDYGTFSAGPFPQPAFDARLVAVKEFFMALVSSLSFPAVVLGAIGVLYCFKKDKFLGTALFLSFFLSGPFFAAYANFPIINTFVLGAVERFYLFSHVIFIIFFAFGLEGLLLFLKRFFSRPEYAALTVCVFGIIPIMLFRANYRKTDLSRVSVGTDFGYDIMRNTDKNSLLIVSGDTKAFNSWYVHFVLGYRLDLEAIQLGNFGVRNNYFNSIYKKVAKNNINSDSIELFAKAVKDVLKEKKVFSSDQVKGVDKGFVWVPRGMLFELVKDTEVPSESEYEKMVSSDWGKIKVPTRASLSIAERSLTVSDIPTYYSDAITTAGLFMFTRYHNTDEAFKLFNKAINIDPLYSKSYAARSQIYNDRGECRNAEEDIKKAVSLSPVEPQYYILWYLYERDCLKDENEKYLVSLKFEKIFHADIKKEVKNIKK